MELPQVFIDNILSIVASLGVATIAVGGAVRLIKPKWFNVILKLFYSSSTEEAGARKVLAEARAIEIKNEADIYGIVNKLLQERLTLQDEHSKILLEHARRMQEMELQILALTTREEICKQEVSRLNDEIQKIKNGG